MNAQLFLDSAVATPKSTPHDFHTGHAAGALMRLQTATVTTCFVALYLTGVVVSVALAFAGSTALLAVLFSWIAGMEKAPEPLVFCAAVIWAGAWACGRCYDALLERLAEERRVEW